MANFVSPGVYVIENDVSDYPAQVNSSVVGIVGFAGKGPIAGKSGKKATLITSQASLIDLFGEPSENISGQAIEGALEILETTTSMYFVRCADDNAAEATINAPLGGCPAVQLPGGGMGGFATYPGTTDVGVSSVRVTVESTSVDNNGVALYPADKVFTIVAGSTALAAADANYNVGLAYKKAIGGDLGDSKVGIHYNAADDFAYLVGKSAGKNAKLVVSLAKVDPADSTNTSTGSWLREVDGVGALESAAGGEVVASGVSVDTSSVAYKVQSVYPGDSYNLGTKSNGDTSGVSFEVDALGASNMLISVNNNGQAAEGFTASVLSGAAYMEELIGTSVITATSEYITGSFVSGAGSGDLDALTGIAKFDDKLSTLGTLGTLTGVHGVTAGTVNPRFVKLVKGTYGLASGNSGIPTVESDVAAAVIGLVESDGGRSGIEALDDDLLNISIALVPGEGVGDIQSVQNALITKAETTKNFLAVLSPKFNVGKLQDAIDWSNGLTETRTAAINSSYASLYWPWLKVFSVFDSKDRWYDPAIFAVRQMTYTDAVADPWWAPAGFVRGRLTKPLETEVVLNQGDRDTMYSGGNVLNPVVNFPQTGIAIWGQRTSQRAPSALDRINVRRMMIYLRKVILASTQRLVFEPNDRFTWARVEGLINPLLADITRRRGITEFKVICDEKTNTPLRVDRNEMWCKVLIKPTKTAEMVVFELNLTSQSASI